MNLLRAISMSILSISVVSAEMVIANKSSSNSFIEKCCSGCGSFCHGACNACNTTGSLTGLPCDTIFNTALDDASSDRCLRCDLCRGNCAEDGLRSCHSECAGRTIFIPRSVGANTARELLGWQTFIHVCDPKGYYISGTLVPGYARSFKPKRLARLLFGNNVLNFAGSQVASRRNCQLIADYFGLPTTFRGSIAFRPFIENIYLDTECFIGLDALICGLYVRAHAPFVHTRWHLKGCECTDENRIASTNSLTTLPGCYMANDVFTPAATSIKQALSGEFTFGDFKHHRKFGNFCFGTRTLTGVADVDLIVGWDFWKFQEYHAGIYLQAVAPTGNRPDPRFVFNPIIGNGKHWELGAGVSGHLLLWEKGPDSRLTIWIEGNVTHMFKTDVVRSFDLRRGLLSRYMLLKEFQKDGVTYSGNLINAIDATTRKVQVSVPVKGDVSVKLAYRTYGVDVDLGYNLYGHAAEKLTHLKNCALRTVGIKGTQGVCFDEFAVNPDGTFGQFIGTSPLNTTASRSTISKPGQPNNPATPAVLQAGTVAVAWNNTRTEGPTTGDDLVIAYESQPPILVSDRTIDFCSGLACPFATQKVFGYAGYTLDEDCYAVSGFIGIGGEVEFEALARNQRSSLNQWSVFIKGGLSY